MTNAETKSINITELHQLLVSDVEINEIPSTDPVQNPTFDFNFDVASVDGLKSIKHDYNAVDIILTDEKCASLGIRPSTILGIDVSFPENEFDELDLSVTWKPVGAANLHTSHLIRMYQDEIVEVFGSVENFFENPTAIIDWVAAHVAKGTPSQW